MPFGTGATFSGHSVLLLGPTATALERRLAVATRDDADRLPETRRSAGQTHFPSAGTDGATR
jgi:hypothetical protein